MKCASYCCLLIGQLICYSLQSQFYFSSGNKTEPELLWEAGIAAGAMNGLTDIGGSNGLGKKFIKDINWNQTQPGAGLFVSAAWHYQFALRFNAGIGRVAGTDAVLANSHDEAHNRYLRNLQFRTDIAEFSLLSEIHPLMLIDNNRNVPLLSPYLAAGVGAFLYSPKAFYNNTWVSLRPLHTEGQGFRDYPDRQPYGPWSWCIPLGVGIKYDAARILNFRFEVLYRFTGTDYLDDVSTSYIDPSLFSHYLSAAEQMQAIKLADRTGEITTGIKNNTGAVRGNPSNRDAFFSCMLSASIVLGRMQRK